MSKSTEEENEKQPVHTIDELNMLIPSIEDKQTLLQLLRERKDLNLKDFTSFKELEKEDEGEEKTKTWKKNLTILEDLIADTRKIMNTLEGLGNGIKEEKEFLSTYLVERAAAHSFSHEGVKTKLDEFLKSEYLSEALKLCPLRRMLYRAIFEHWRFVHDFEEDNFDSFKRSEADVDFQCFFRRKYDFFLEGVAKSSPGEDTLFDTVDCLSSVSFFLLVLFDTDRLFSQENIYSSQDHEHFLLQRQSLRSSLYQLDDFKLLDFDEQLLFFLCDNGMIEESVDVRFLYSKRWASFYVYRTYRKF